MGNFSNIDDNDSDDSDNQVDYNFKRKKLTEEEKNDPCYKSVVGGKKILDLPYDSLGEILEYVESFRDLRSFMISCKEIFDFFQNRGGIEKVTFTLNPSQNVSRMKPLKFVHRLKCSVGVDEVSMSSLIKFPNIRYLNLRNCNNLNSDLFKHFQHLTEFHWLGLKFEVNHQIHDLPQSLKALSFRRRKGDHIKLGELGNFLNERKEQLEHIELWRYKENSFLHGGKKHFFEDLKSFEHLRVLRLRNCFFQSLSIPNFNFFTNGFPDKLEELDLSGFKIDLSDILNKKESIFEKRICFPKSLKVLNLDDIDASFFEYVVDMMTICEGIEVMDISRQERYNSYIQTSSDSNSLSLLDKLIPKVPNLKVLDMKNIIITDVDNIDVLLKAKELDIVTVTMKSIFTTTKNKTLTKLKYNHYGVQQVGKIKFLVY